MIAASAAPAVKVDGNLATIRFDRFDLESYRQFLICKSLPESETVYDWQTDSYRVITPARFAARFGVEDAITRGAMLPLADHLFDYQRWAVELALEARRFALWADTGLASRPGQPGNDRYTNG